MRLGIDNLTKRELKKLLKALQKTEQFGCPEDKYRVAGQTNCFYCNECLQYAINNKLSQM